MREESGYLGCNVLSRLLAADMRSTCGLMWMPVRRMLLAGLVLPGPRRAGHSCASHDHLADSFGRLHGKFTNIRLDLVPHSDCSLCESAASQGDLHVNPLADTVVRGKAPDLRLEALLCLDRDGMRARQRRPHGQEPMISTEVQNPPHVA